MGWINMRTASGYEMRFWAESLDWLIHIMLLMHRFGTKIVWWRLDKEP